MVSDEGFQKQRNLEQIRPIQNNDSLRLLGSFFLASALIVKVMLCSRADLMSNIVGLFFGVADQHMLMISFTILGQRLPSGGRSPSIKTDFSNSFADLIWLNGFLSAHISQNNTPKEYTSAGRL